jgi:hypothetical protein
MIIIKNLAWLLRNIEAGKSARAELPKEEFYTGKRIRQRFPVKSYVLLKLRSSL